MVFGKGVIFKHSERNGPVSEKTVEQVLIDCRGHFSNFTKANIVKTRLDYYLDKLFDSCDEFSIFFEVEEIGKSVFPRGEERVPAKFLRLHVDHTTSTDSSR